MHSLYPRLVVPHADTAIATYIKVFGATLIERFADNQGRIVHAAMNVGGGVFSLAETVPEWGLLDPVSLGGSACLLMLEREDPDASAAAMVQAGGEIRVPIADRPWGKREGRVADPFGHLWILSTSIEDVSSDEIARRLRG
jgi:uncharacterized glyoxalase superfamily protein PhnB